MRRALWRCCVRTGYCVSEFLADRVKLVGELLAARGNRDFTPCLFNQAARDILLALQGDQGCRIIEAHEGVQDPLHLLEVARRLLHIPATEMFEREPAQLPDDITEAEEVCGVREAQFLRTGKGILFQNRVDEERLARFLHRVLNGSGVVQVRMVLQEAPQLQDLLPGLLESRADIVPAMHRLNRAPAQSGDRAGGFDRQLPDLVLLVQPCLDLGDDVIEILHALGCPIPLFEGWLGPHSRQGPNSSRPLSRSLRFLGGARGEGTVRRAHGDWAERPGWPRHRRPDRKGKPCLGRGAGRHVSGDPHILVVLPVPPVGLGRTNPVLFRGTLARIVLSLFLFVYAALFYYSFLICYWNNDPRADKYLSAPTDSSCSD